MDVGKLNFDDPEIKAAYKDVLNESSDTDWMSITYKDNTAVLRLYETGSGGLDGFKNELEPGKALFGYVRVKLPHAYRYVYITWCPHGLPATVKGQLNNHSSDVGKWYQPVHLQVNARDEDDIDEDEIVTKLKRAAASAMT